MVETQPIAVIGEPTELQVVHAHKGICKLKVTSIGEAAHSSTREGRNANLAMIPFLQTAKALYEETESNTTLHNTEFDPPTMSWNIGINDHTAAVNVKPARSVCTIFYRPLPHVDDSPCIERVRQAALACGLEFAEPERCDAMYTDPKDEFVASARAIVGQATPKTVSYGTDGGVLTELRRKFVCGPGSIDQAHTSDEWIALAQLEQGEQLYRTFVETWCVGS
jgi:acetylornithine deacetylase